MKAYNPPIDGFFIGSLEIKFYGLIMAIAMLIGVLLACKLAKKNNIKSDDIFMLALIMLPCSIIGARLYYCIFYEYNYSFIEFFKIHEGGLAIYGGVIGGLIGIIIFALIKKNFKLVWKICDICVPCLILGQALGRWGNFFNQEAYGDYISNPNLKWFPFGVFIENCYESGCSCGGNGASGWHLATFFYESLWNLIGFAILMVVYYKSNSTGTTTAAYLTWYGIGRMFIEGLRLDSLYVGNSSIRVSQLLSLLLVLLGIAILICIIVKKIKEKRRGANG